MSKLREQLAHAATTLRWAGPLMWSTSRRHCLGVACGTLIAALVAPATVLLMGRVVALVQAGLAAPGAAPADARLWIVLAGVAALATAAAAATHKYSMQRLIDGVGLRARRMVLQRAAQLELEALEGLPMQNELTLAMQDPGGVIVRSVTELASAAGAGVQIACLAAIMLSIEPGGTLAVLLASLPLLASSGVLSVLRHRLRCQNAETQRWTRYYARHLTNDQLAPAVRVLGLADWMIARSTQRLQKLQEARRRVDWWELVARLGTSAAAIALLILAVFSVARQAADGVLEVGRFVAFWLAAWRLAKDSGTLAGAVAATAESWLNVDRLHRFLLHPVAGPPRQRRIARPMRGELRLEGVSFRYPLAQRDALSDVSLHIRSGESIAIVGHNGAGKSTLAKLIAGLYVPTCGTLSYDGVPHDEVDLEQLHQRTAILLQRPLRLEGTVHENIAIGDWDRLAGDRDAVRRLAEQMGLQQEIERMPHGYETRLGRMFGDHDLSGGQWQKLAIARALARDPTIVLFDEPTSGLDVYAEIDVLRSLKSLCAGRTSIVISHRFSTVVGADRIVVVERGRVVEQGPHAQLLAQNGLYASMWRAQERRAA